MTASLGLRPPVARAVTVLSAHDPGAVPQAERDALRRYMADLPDPAAYAASLPLGIADLLEAHIAMRGGPHAVSEAVAKRLRPYGLCEVQGRHLSNFGCAVRRAIIGED